MVIKLMYNNKGTVAVAYGTYTVPIWLTTTCPKTLIVTLGDVLKSDNAKKTASIWLDSFELGVESYIYSGMHVQ